MSLLEIASIGRPYIINEKTASGPAFRQELACVASQATGRLVRAEELPRIVINKHGLTGGDSRLKAIKAEDVEKEVEWQKEVAEKMASRGTLSYAQSATEVWNRLADIRIAKEMLGSNYDPEGFEIMVEVARGQTDKVVENARVVKQTLNRRPGAMKVINDSLPRRRESHIYGMQVLKGMDAYDEVPEVAYLADEVTAQAIDAWSPLSGVVEAATGGVPGWGGKVTKALIHPDGIVDYAHCQSRTNSQTTNIDASIDFINGLTRSGREWPTHVSCNEGFLLLNLAVLKAWDYWWSKYPRLDDATTADVCSAIVMNQRDQIGGIYDGAAVGLVRDMSLGEVGLLGDLSLDRDLLDRINHNQGAPRYLANKATRSVGLKKPYFKDWPRVEVTSDSETRGARNKWTARSYVGDDNGFKIHPEAVLEVAQIMADYDERETKKREMRLDDSKFARVLFEKAAVVTMAAVMLDAVEPEHRDQMMGQVVKDVWNVE